MYINGIFLIKMSENKQKDFWDLGSSYLWNKNRYQQTVKAFFSVFNGLYYLLANKRILMHMHFKIVVRAGILPKSFLQTPGNYYL